MKPETQKTPLMILETIIIKKIILSIFAPSALISARCARGNHFDHKISYVHHDLEIMCSARNHFDLKISYVHHDLEIMCIKFHLDRTKNARSARIFIRFFTFNADFRALRARKSRLT